jgi:hypothetical protein
MIPGLSFMTAPLKETRIKFFNREAIERTTNLSYSIANDAMAPTSSSHGNQLPGDQPTRVCQHAVEDIDFND